MISIIVPTLNEAPGILSVLTPLQTLRRRGHELILVDGGSADGTVDLAIPLVDRVLVVGPGRAAQMNAGAALASGDALLLLHADTRLPAQAESLIRRALRQHRWGRFDVHIQGRSRLLPLVAAMMNLRSRLTGIATGDQAIFVDRAAFETLGGVPDQPLMEDIELSRRLKTLGPPACLSERVVTSGRRWDSRGCLRTMLTMWRLRFDYWRGRSPKELALRYR